MAKKERKFYLVQEDLLPEAILKTVLAKELLLRGDAATVNEAVKKVDLSRSAFYKYKDGVFPFHQWSPGVTVTLAMVLEHRSGILSKVLGILAAARANILTINQNVPVHGLASVTVTFETAGLEGDLDNITKRIRELDGVREVNPVGHSLV
ncbi:MAG: ACT domain-containing protein [Pelotomaculum sp.]|nr:ACT domain-containing protein [Pelotomaculum sp.]